MRLTSSLCRIIFVIFLLYFDVSPLRKSAIEKFVHASMGSEQTTDTCRENASPGPNCQSSAFSVIVRAGVRGPKSIRKLKRVGPKQTYLSLGEFVSPPMWRTFWMDDPCPSPLLPCVSSGQWFVDGMALTHWPLQYWYYSHLGHRRGGPRVPLWAVTFVPEWNFDIFYLDVFLLCCFCSPPFCFHPSLCQTVPSPHPLQTPPKPLTFSQQVLFCLIPEKVTFGSIGSGE